MRTCECICLNCLTTWTCQPTGAKLPPWLQCPVCSHEAAAPHTFTGVPLTPLGHSMSYFENQPFMLLASPAHALTLLQDPYPADRYPTL